MVKAIQGIDYSYGPPAWSDLKKASVKAIGRYYTRLTYHKRITASEAQTILGHNLGILPFFQIDGEKPSEFGASHGTAHAKLARKNAVKVGQPNGTIICFDVDFEAKPGDLAGLKAYFGAVCGELHQEYLVAVYGSELVCKAIMDAGLADASVVTTSWPHGTWTDQKADVVQYSHNTKFAGIQCDKFRIQNAGLKLWYP